MGETRQVIQIVTGRLTLGSHTLYALCNDGTVWWRDRVGEQDWAPLPPIPQPGAEETAP